MSVVVATDLSKTYSTGATTVEALKHLTFAIEPASFVSFIGPSGSGKTTLLNLVGGLDRPTSGTLTVAGVDVSGLDRRHAAMFRGAHLGFIFQDFNLMPVLTVYENVEYPLLLVRSTPAAERATRVRALLDSVGIRDLAQKYPDQISGGQKQRVAVARALVTDPAIVLADEPTANLDTKTAASVIDLMKQMKDRLGTTFIFSTHDPRVVNEAEVLYRLEDGAIAERKVQGGQPPWASSSRSH
jgi:putative ABC transport system ATP-binding protein